MLRFFVCRPCARPPQGMGICMQVACPRFYIFLAIAERQQNEVGMCCHFGVKSRSIAATIKNPPSIFMGVDSADNLGQLIRLASIQDAVRSPVLFQFAFWVSQDVGGWLFIENCPQAN